jgi:hypothetical protein
MSECPILHDLCATSRNLRAALRRFRKNELHCARCPSDPCPGKSRLNLIIIQEINLALAALKKEPER